MKRFAESVFALLIFLLSILVLWQNGIHPQSSASIAEPTPPVNRSFKNVIKGITSVREEMRLSPDGDIIFSYKDADDWETGSPLRRVSIKDLPIEEPVVTVQTPNSYYKISDFPVNDYEVTGLPWKVMITNNHSRGLYEEYKLNKGSKKYTLLNWDYHDDVNIFTKDYIFDPGRVTIANWVSNAYYDGVAKAPVYWFNCFAKKPDSDYPIPGKWEMQIPLSTEKKVSLDGIIINVKPDDISIAVSYFEELMVKAENNSVWLSLCGDCFSEPDEKIFDKSSFRAKMLEEIIAIAVKYPEKIAFIHFARSPDYTGDMQGLNRFLVERLKMVGG